MKQTKVKLSDANRAILRGFTSRGLHRAREINRGHILAALDRGVPEKQIMAVLGVGRTAIWRTRAAYLEKGVEYALADAPRSGAPRRYAVKQETAVVALACSAPPSGAKRWTIDLLTEEVRKREADLRTISRESIRRFLKKTLASPGGEPCGVLGV